MRSFRDLGIREKMQSMTLLICGAVLLVVVASLFTFQVVTFRSTFLRDTRTLAAVIANNSYAPMAFSDEKHAAEVVGSLRANPTVLAASLVLPDGAVFASFGKPERADTLSEFPPAGTSRFRGGQLLVTQPVTLDGDRAGTLYLRSDYRGTFLDLLGFYVRMVAVVLLVASVLGVFLSSRLSRNITDPVLELARTAQVVGEKKDYSVRAVVGPRADELGRLTEAFNEMLSRIQSQDAALSLSQQRMQALIDSIDGIVWERSPDNLQFTFVSRQGETILGYPLQNWLAQANFWAEHLHPQDRAKATQAGQELAAAGQPYSHEYRMVAADGQTLWIRESGMVLVEKGKRLALRGILLDITRQKQDAEELDKLNRRLIDTSRQAGMADVASGVLHNVGNVLNSVGVAATVVSKRLRELNITNLRRATALFRDHEGQLATFLTADPKGKLLPEYLETMAEQLGAEQTKLVGKMELVSQKIDHIKEIVAMQQSYARVSGAYECLPAAELVEDALRINSAAFDRHGIELAREYEPRLPAVWVDRHKVLQILINVLRNAKYAMQANAPESKRLVIRISKASPEKVRISIQDNGVGIPAENLTRIFNHGFTTRKDGHGFGLHSGANAAKEMGGCLRAHSDGPGRGAEFILELPTTSTARQERQPATKGTLCTKPTLNAITAS